MKTYTYVCIACKALWSFLDQPLTAPIFKCPWCGITVKTEFVVETTANAEQNKETVN